MQHAFNDIGFLSSGEVTVMEKTLRTGLQHIDQLRVFHSLLKDCLFEFLLKFTVAGFMNIIIC